MYIFKNNKLGSKFVSQSFAKERGRWWIKRLKEDKDNETLISDPFVLLLLIINSSSHFRTFFQFLLLLFSPFFFLCARYMQWWKFDLSNGRSNPPLIVQRVIKDGLKVIRKRWIANTAAIYGWFSILVVKMISSRITLIGNVWLR